MKLQSWYTTMWYTQPFYETHIHFVQLMVSAYSTAFALHKAAPFLIGRRRKVFCRGSVIFSWISSLSKCNWNLLTNCMLRDFMCRGIHTSLGCANLGECLCGRSEQVLGSVNMSWILRNSQIHKSREEVCLMLALCASSKWLLLSDQDKRQTLLHLLRSSTYTFPRFAQTRYSEGERWKCSNSCCTGKLGWSILMSLHPLCKIKKNSSLEGVSEWTHWAIVLSIYLCNT